MKAFWLLLFLGCLQEKEVQVEESTVTFTKIDSLFEMAGSIEIAAQDVLNADTIMSWRFAGNEFETLFEFTLHPNDSISFYLNPEAKMDKAAKEFFDYIRRALKALADAGD